MFLAASVNSYDWYGCGGQHCSDRFDRKSWRLCWTLYRGLDQGHDPELRGGTLFPERVRRTGRNRDHACATFIQPERCSSKRSSSGIDWIAMPDSLRAPNSCLGQLDEIEPCPLPSPDCRTCSEATDQADGRGKLPSSDIWV